MTDALTRTIQSTDGAGDQYWFVGGPEQTAPVNAYWSFENFSQNAPNDY